MTGPHDITVKIWNIAAICHIHIIWSCRLTKLIVPLSECKSPMQLRLCWHECHIEHFLAEVIAILCTFLWYPKSEISIFLHYKDTKSHFFLYLKCAVAVFSLTNFWMFELVNSTELQQYDVTYNYTAFCSCDLGDLVSLQRIKVPHQLGTLYFTKWKVHYSIELDKAMKANKSITMRSYRMMCPWFT